MTARPLRVRPAGSSEASRAAQKAAELLESARRAESTGDWALALIGYCHAGIHASDALCARDKGAIARGEDHGEAAQLLRQVRGGAKMVQHLEKVLQVKKRWSYAVVDVRISELRSVGRAATALVDAANAQR